MPANPIKFNIVIMHPIGLYLNNTEGVSVAFQC